MAASDPFYNRKAVPDEVIQDVGFTGLNTTDETAARERKYSRDGGDLRKFWNPKNKQGELDPFYQRKQIPDTMINGVGETGLTKEEEFINRERKYSVNGADVRKFSDSTKKGFHPTDDPYYGRKPVAAPQINGVGETNMTKAEEFESRERKMSMFDLSGDPFQQVTGTGHRQSIVNPAETAVAASAQRRRSSAIAPDVHHAAQHHSGYDGDRLEPIISKYEEPPTDVTHGTTNGSSAVGTHPVGSHSTDTKPVEVRDETGHATGPSGHTTFHDATTRELDNVARRNDDELAPHEVR